MGQPQTVTGRKVQEVNGSRTSTIPSEIAERYGIEKGDTVIWHDEGEGEIRVRPPSKE